MMEYTSNVDKFIVETTVPDTGAVPSKEFLATYTEWCEANREYRLSSTGINNFIRHYVSWVKYRSGYEFPDGTKGAAYIGIKWK